MIIKRLEYKYLVALIYTCVLFLDRMDVTIVNIAMPTFAKVFEVPITRTEWISTGFLMSLAIVIPISGWLGDKFGYKKIFILGTIIFTLGSLFCASSWSLSSLIMFRVLKGLGGGILVPVGMTMTYRAFSHTEFSKAASYTLMPTLVAPAIAPTFGGFVLEHFSWRWIFLFNVPIGMLAIFLSIIYLKEEKLPSAPPLDWFGFFLSAIGLASLLYTFSRVGHFGLGDELVWVCLLIAIFSMGIFIFWEKIHLNPLIDLKFFKVPLFVQANLIQFCLQITHFGSLFIIAIYLQIGVGMTPFQSGLAMCTQPIGSIMLLPIVPKIFNRFGPKYLIFWGLIGLSGMTYLIPKIQVESDFFFAACLLWVRGLVLGLINAPIQASVLFNIKKEDAGRASSLFNAGRQIAISFGVALSSLVLASGFREFNISSTDIMLNKSSLPIFERVFILLSAISFLAVFITLTISNKQILEKLRTSNSVAKKT
ncbi:DHA2 family efflux MFS transporter permease subunit [Pigmentibacter sp. JX0631]|uniref:DHA2 family efflux MFS transporter permease subunit n=1 Tax=Pigmentibacter sp. JX0631 TaxID=2976982 RepID=UPI002468D5F3|nr:DHA2 family efflux MFS transporter permease subunit [Pigmentibacter sp. JX0631]WGL60079.1 DHA2 family efflux MFS transporter permease subunit [Pigmentibacter sp. JX0631]